MVVFLLSSVGLRVYLNWITKTGYTYGALAAPIAFLLLMFFIGLAVVGGAYFNSALQELWPAKATRRQRRKWRRLEMERASERLRTEEGRKLWERSTMPLRRPRPENVNGVTRADAAEPPSDEDGSSPNAPEPAPSAAQGGGSSEGTTRNPPTD
jgi:membrane protein